MQSGKWTNMVLFLFLLFVRVLDSLAIYNILYIYSVPQTCTCRSVYMNVDIQISQLIRLKTCTACFAGVRFAHERTISFGDCQWSTRCCWRHSRYKSIVSSFYRWSTVHSQLFVLESDTTKYLDPFDSLIKSMRCPPQTAFAVCAILSNFALCSFENFQLQCAQLRDFGHEFMSMARCL